MPNNKINPHNVNSNNVNSNNHSIVPPPVPWAKIDAPENNLLKPSEKTNKAPWTGTAIYTRENVDVARLDNYYENFPQLPNIDKYNKK